MGTAIWRKNMSTTNNPFVSYGFSQPLINDAPVPIVAQRPPTTKDKAQLGTIWLDQVAEQGYVLITIENNDAMWEALGGAGGAITFDTDSGSAVPSGNVIDIAGGLNMNTAGATNVVTINLDDTVSITGSFTAGTTAGFITSETGDITAVAGNINLPNTNAAGTEGIITFGGDRFVNNIGTDNTFVGSDAGNLATTGIGSNVGIGRLALNSVTTGSENVAIGLSASEFKTSGVGNVVVGSFAGQSMTDGQANVLIGRLAAPLGNFTSSVIIGHGAMGLGTSGDFNVLIGANVCDELLTGTNNICIGNEAGGSFETNESNNISIGNPGFIGESGAIRIGTDGIHNTCFIEGISGVTVTGAAVLCSVGGQLGTIASSERYKENISPISNKSDNIFSLNPVVFNYKKDESKKMHYGLIAEEVKEILPELVLYNQAGEIETLAYHELPILLLNELIKMRKRVIELEKLQGVI